MTGMDVEQSEDYTSISVSSVTAAITAFCFPEERGPVRLCYA
jgi:hypothetical protein